MDPYRRTIRPIGVYALQGLTFAGDRLLALDAVRGYLLQVDWATDNTRILNPQQVNRFIDANGLAVWEDTLWFTRGHEIFSCKIDEWIPERFVSLPYTVDGVAVWRSTLYVSCHYSESILIYDLKSGRRITSFPAPGIGVENLTIRGEELWVCDRTEQTVYCMDRATGEVLFGVLTPFSDPTAIAFHPDPEQSLCYVSYAGEEPYIRDNPNSVDPYELTFRDRTFIHPLHFHYNSQDGYALSNGYLIEMSYVEEISALEDAQVILNDLEWRIALPTNTHRQTVRQVDWVGIPFEEEIQDGQRVAVFKFDTFKAQEPHVFGWKALIEVRSIKYRLKPRDVEQLPELSPDFKARYLVDDDDLAMHTSVIQDAARDAIGREKNFLRQVINIRNYVYDRMAYGIKPHIDTPDVALTRGIGSCGEYVGILLALLRLNGIVCRTVGRYKCPPQNDRRNIPLQPDFNHVWIEFYVPGYGWVPMESNADDIQEGGPYPTRFFMALPWYHAEIAKGITFEKLKGPNVPDKEKLSIGQLAINHVRFTILDELPPPA